MRIFRFALIVLAFAGAAAAQEQPTWLKMSIAAEAVDPEALHNAAEPGNMEQQKLVEATELAWMHRDAEAAVALRASADTAKVVAVRLDSLNMLMAVHLRSGNYALAAAAGRESKSLARPSPGQSDLLTAADALKDTPPMTQSGQLQGLLRLRLEKDGIPRAKVAINGQDQEAIFDTGASFSVISQSVAKKAGVRTLKSNLRIAPGGGHETRAGIGVADELTLAETEFRNVVVVILPDKDMDIFGEAKVDAIIGLPVFLKMGTIGMQRDRDGFAFAYRPSTGQPGPASNLRLNKLGIIVSGVIKHPAPTPINMMLDTGSNSTSFYRRFTASFPDLVADAPTVSNKSAVIGTATLSRQARELGKISFSLGGQDFGLGGVHLYDDQRPAYHGLLGLDVLGIGFVADFGAMTFTLAALRTPAKDGQQ